MFLPSHARIMTSKYSLMTEYPGIAATCISKRLLKLQMHPIETSQNNEIQYYVTTTIEKLQCNTNPTS